MWGKFSNIKQYIQKINKYIYSEMEERISYCSFSPRLHRKEISQLLPLYHLTTTSNYHLTTLLFDGVSNMKC